jgi:hypothetical protein
MLRHVAGEAGKGKGYFHCTEGRVGARAKMDGLGKIKSLIFFYQTNKMHIPRV